MTSNRERYARVRIRSRTHEQKWKQQNWNRPMFHMAVIRISYGRWWISAITVGKRRLLANLIEFMSAIANKIPCNTRDRPSTRPTHSGVIHEMERNIWLWHIHNGIHHNMGMNAPVEWIVSFFVNFTMFVVPSNAFLHILTPIETGYTPKVIFSCVLRCLCVCTIFLLFFFFSYWWLKFSGVYTYRIWIRLFNLQCLRAFHAFAI